MKALYRAAPAELILDFARVTFMDSSGIGLVMGRFRLIAGNRRKGNFAKSSGSASKSDEAGRIGQAG